MLPSYSLRSLHSWCQFVVLGLALQPLSASADLDPLAKTAFFTPTVTFEESHSDKLVSFVDRSDPEFPFTMREVISSESVSVTVVANIAGIDLSAIDETTSYSLTLGNLNISGSLSDDELYVKGKTSIFIPALGYNDAGKPIGKHGVKLSWTATRLSITVTGATASAMPGTVELDNWTSNGESVPKIRAISSVSLEFDGLTAAARPVYVTGKASFTTKTFGNEETGEESFDLVGVSLAGSCEYASPSTTLISPESGAETGAIATVTGSAADGHGIETIEFALNPTSSEPEWTTVTTRSISELANPDLLWGSTTATWSVSLNALPPGTNRLWVRTQDVSGNFSAPLVVPLVNSLTPQFQSRWDGLLSPSGSHSRPVRGAVTYTFSSNGFYSGKVYLETGTLSISGYLDAAGKVTNTIKRLGKPDLTLTADLLGAASHVGGFFLVGSVKEGSEEAASFEAFPSPYSATALTAANLAGRFHIGIEAPVSPTLGQSYLIATTTRPGKVSITGRMADGTAITWSGVLGVDGQVPLFVPLYSTMYLTKGSVASTLIIDGGTGTLPATPLQWVRPLGATDKQFPSGYDVTLSASGNLHIPVTRATLGLAATTANAVATLSGDAITGTLTKTFTVNANNSTAVVLPNPNSVVFSAIPGATGLGTGSFKLPGTATAAAINYLIVGSKAFGHYIAPAQPGTVNKRFGLATWKAADVPN